MKAGALDRRITVQRAGNATDDGYTVQPGALETYCTRQASWQPANGREVFENMGREAKAGGTFWLRYDSLTSAITTTDKVSWNGTTWDIVAIQELGRREGIELIVTGADLMKVEFKGGKELERALSELGSRATKKNVARRALRRAAEPIRDEWERLAPEDEGDLKKAIKIGKAIKSEQRRGNRGDIVSEFIGIDESVDRRLHIYAEVIEFGNESHTAQPAGRPAWEGKKMEAFNRLADDLKDEIDKAAARAARKASK